LIALIRQRAYAEDRGQRTEDGFIRPPSADSRRPNRVGLLKRPVLLQTHPGA
jgi:hypothetical protein